MTQMERENMALRQRYAQQAAAKTAAAQAESARAQAEQLSRKLAAARAEVRRYQTRMFAFERQMIALKHENLELEAACEQAREEAEMAAARAERAERARQEAQQALEALQQAAADPAPAAKLPEPVQTESPAACVPDSKADAEPALPEEPAVVCSAVPQVPAAPQEAAWQPRTELEHLSVELMSWFDAMMPQE